MLAIAVWPLVFAVIGMVLYVSPVNTKWSEIGRLIFFCGFFWLTSTLARATFELAR